MKLIKSLLIFLLLSQTVSAQTIDDCYQRSYVQLDAMLTVERLADFKKAVFLVENAWHKDTLNYSDFIRNLEFYAGICEYVSQANPLEYTYDDFQSVCNHAAIFQFMTKMIPILVNDTTTLYHPPFEYNFEDYAGKEDWSNMFVTTLMNSHKGNCHSLPILYKLIAEEMGEKAWLALAPNHIYIKLHNKQSGWYNTELTSGNFPTDVYIKSSGYIHLDAIQNGIYMDTLSVKQSIALCIIDLALGYKHKYPENYDPHFVLKCCNKALEHFPDFINALLLKASTHYQIYENSSENAPATLDEIEEQFDYIHQLGYRKMPEEMYLKWLEEMKEEKVYN